MKKFERRFAYIILLMICFAYGMAAVPVIAAETEESVTEAPATEESGTENTATEAPATEESVTEAPITEAPATEEAEVKTGWQRIDGKTYYFSPGNGEMLTGWQKIAGKKYYFSPGNGEMFTGKRKIGTKTYYFNANGVMQTGRKKIGNAVYYFNAKGVMKTGWVKTAGKKYYFSPQTGKMFTGKRKIGKKTYYFNEKGVMKTGWIKTGKKTYYCNKKGVMKTGWLKDKGNTYYFSPKNNKMLTGWQKISGKTYYFSPSGNTQGALQRNCIVGSAKSGYYYVDKDGVQVAAKEMVQAVQFVMAFTNPAWSNEAKLAACYDALWKNYDYQRFYETPTAQNMPEYASYMFTYGKGNCYRYAASFACIAKVLGYDSRVAVGGVSCRSGGLTPHGWTEIWVNGAWYICDANMQRNYPKVNSYMCTEKTYPYTHACSAIYTPVIEKGQVYWR
ncbi:MAG: hypothetical protein NC300_04305 [Bacteroidales bacterium]|nr:hypothetical protein [Clostridium sp.]MCM1203342.1 hypothetical protein [Bacteroidales bacterium]